MWFRSTLLLSLLILGAGCTELTDNGKPGKGSAGAAQVPFIAQPRRLPLRRLKPLKLRPLTRLIYPASKRRTVAFLKIPT